MIRVRPLMAADLTLGLYLCRQAGWNQTAADWQRFLDLQPCGCFVAEWDGTPAGTTTTSSFGPVAWIAMVIVDKSVRGRGVGKALLNHALEFLDQRGAATIRLDATPLGQPLYERLGFVEQFQLARYAGTLGQAQTVPEVEQALPAEWEELAALDEAVTRTDRRRLLERLFAEQPGSVRLVRRGDRVGGFLIGRPGYEAFQLGPCIAAPEAGPALLADAWHRHADERILIDIPVGNEAATRLAEAQGLTVERRFTRMCRGLPRCERIDWLWASSGGEKG